MKGDAASEKKKPWTEGRRKRIMFIEKGTYTEKPPTIGWREKGLAIHRKRPKGLSGHTALKNKERAYGTKRALVLQKKGWGFSRRQGSATARGKSAFPLK